MSTVVQSNVGPPLDPVASNGVDRAGHTPPATSRSRSTSLSSKNPYNIARPGEDPFQPDASTGPPPPTQRFSQFDSQVFDLDSTASPSQMKRVLEAHLAETERRIQDASKLGTTLVQQRRDLTRRLQDVQEQQKNGAIAPELKQKLLDIEREYHEVGRESARAMLAPKSTAAGPDGSAANASAASPYPLDGRGRPASPNKYTADAPDSPSKMTAPSRKGRNQSANGVQDSEFYAEISTSLLTQVRNLQAVLAERDEALKAVSLEKSQLELEAQGLAQRVRSMDESEQRYKDENWSLETQLHDLLAKVKQAADREQKMSQQLSLLNVEKSTAEKDLDELRQVHSKLTDDHAAVVKHHEVELSSIRRDLTAGESEKVVLQRKLEELNVQNNELAQVVATRLRQVDSDAAADPADDNLDYVPELTTPEHSPPPSPSKGTPRHSMLESETLKSSLHHAHRMIQNLKGNINREKAEKAELKRMLQEARDEIEMRRSDSGPALSNAAKRRKPTSEKELFKKPLKPTLLGAGRSSKDEILADEPEWEDHSAEAAALRDGSDPLASKRTTFGGRPGSAAAAGHDQSVTESSDAFETANERETDNDAFQTGAESLGGDSNDELTETEDGPAARGSRPGMHTAANRDSFHSTASTSADEERALDLKTPTLQQQQRYRLKMGRGGLARRSRASGELAGLPYSPNSAKDSPASFLSNNSPAPVGQSLFSELGELDGDELGPDGTPSRASILSRGSNAGSRPGTAKRLNAAVPVETKDSGMMTEPWEPLLVQREFALTTPSPTSSTDRPPLHPLTAAMITSLDHPPADDDSSARAAPLQASAIHSQHTQPLSTTVSAAPSPLPLTMSAIQSQATEPVAAAAIENSSEAASTPASARDLREDTPEKSDGARGDQPRRSLFGSMLNWRKPSGPSVLPETTGAATAEDTPEKASTAREVTTPVRETPAVGESADDQVVEGANSPSPMPKLTPPAVASAPVKEMADQGAQTALSAEDIENMLKDKGKKASVVVVEEGRKPAPLSPSRMQHGQPIAPVLRTNKSQESVGAGSVGRARTRMAEPGFGRDESAPLKSSKRPGSSSSHRSSTAGHPPLPADHKQAIAAAAQRVSSDQTGLMGPPLAPASASRAAPPSRRPTTPSSQIQQSPSTRGGTTPRPRHSARSDVTSPVGTRRSSVSSFASELDERFNIRADNFMGQGLDVAGTDPRMIQAITTTMIGEYLWKYTRKAGRSQTSDKRHRRFFWIHPYTRTLYWSETNPATAGRAEVKAKSVRIESVRAVGDDNPLPPGLHRKSIIVVTPGRSVKFTATTQALHETWFNALSYLLVRTGAEGSTAQAYEANEYYQGMTAADVEEFNPSMRPIRSRGATSLSSYNSRTTRQTSPSREAGVPSQRSRLGQSGAPVVNSVASRTSQISTQTGSISRFSTILRSGTAIRGSFASRKSRNSARESIYDASEVHDSAEDLRERYARQERDADRLENVRACCDGKHDVGSLAKKPHHHHQHGSRTSRYSQQLLNQDAGGLRQASAEASGSTSQAPAQIPAAGPA